MHCGTCMRNDFRDISSLHRYIHTYTHTHTLSQRYTSYQDTSSLRGFKLVHENLLSSTIAVALYLTIPLP